MVNIEELKPIAVGLADGVSDAAIAYIDKATGEQGKPLLHRPSTAVHIGIGIVAAVGALTVFKGDASLMAGMIGGRHIGKVVSDYIETKEAGGGGSSSGSLDITIQPVEPAPAPASTPATASAGGGFSV